MRKMLIVICFFLPKQTLFGQCIDRINVEEGYTSGQIDYFSYCAWFAFSYDGDTSKHWIALGQNIDYSQLPASIKKLKTKTDKFIHSYAGDSFSSKVVFEEVFVSYPDSIKKFREKVDVQISNCRAKCAFIYRYRFDSLASFRFQVAINNSGQIIQKNTIPSKTEFKPFDKNFSYCKIIAIAKKRKKDIEPIDNISLEYHAQKKKIYWRITEKNKNTHLGARIIYAVLVDAADISKSRLVKSEGYSIE
jgi:hypothetical protein